MNLAEALVAEFKAEAPKTRVLLERVPWDEAPWKPHDKSMSLGMLASHLAEMLEWVEPILTLEELQFDPTQYKPYFAASKKELLERFDTLVKSVGDNLIQQSDKDLAKVWKMKAGDKVLMEMPRSAVIRYMILSHAIHHRGQLTVYLRIQNVLIPSIYGPSADEPVF